MPRIHGIPIITDRKYEKEWRVLISLLLDKRIATSFILEDEGNIVVYFCLLNDKLSRQDVTSVIIEI